MEGLDPERESGIALVLAVQALSARVDSAERSLAEHVRHVDNKLDSVAEQAREIAVLRNKVDHLSSRFDILFESIEEKLEKTHDYLNMLHDKLDNRFTVCRASCESRIVVVAEEQEVLGNELHSWLNRGLGAWGVAVILFAVIGWFGARWLDTMEKTTDELVFAISGLSIMSKNHEFILNHGKKEHSLETSRVED